MIRKLNAGKQNDEFTKKCEELDILQKQDDMDDFFSNAEQVLAGSMVEVVMPVPIIYKGRDIKNDGGGQLELNREDYTLSKVKKLAKKKGYNVIISCEKNDGGGKYYLKGKNSTYDQSKKTLDDSKVSGNRSGYKQRKAYLLV